MMNAVFLSASVPVVGRGTYHETADPFLIQNAVREFVTVALGRRVIVWGGHPAITPMVWAVCDDLGVDFSLAVILYQSRFFEDIFPDENRRFANVNYIDAIPEDRDGSLRSMRRAMLSRDDLVAAVFIGGMEGVIDEHTLFTELHPNATILTIPATGGAALELAERSGVMEEGDRQNVDFARTFHTQLNISPTERRAFANLTGS